MRARTRGRRGAGELRPHQRKSPNAPGHHRARLKICHRLFMRVRRMAATGIWNRMSLWNLKFREWFVALLGLPIGE
jgi:hypothetical protein